MAMNIVRNGGGYTDKSIAFKYDDDNWLFLLSGNFNNEMIQ